MRTIQLSTILMLRLSPRRIRTQYPHSLLAIRTYILSAGENRLVLKGSPIQVSGLYGY